MSGETLYELWQRRMLEVSGVGTDLWRELPESDRDAWNFIAEETTS